MPTVWQHLATPPALPGLFLRAALRRGIRSQPLPNLGLRCELSVDPRHLARYRQVCGIAASAYLPAAYPHILAFPLQMQLLTDACFRCRCWAWCMWKTVCACCARSAAWGPLLSASNWAHYSPSKGGVFSLITRLEDQLGLLWEVKAACSAVACKCPAWPSIRQQPHRCRSATSRSGPRQRISAAV